MPPILHFVNTPKQLPVPPAEGRIVLLDLAFAAGDRWLKTTRPFIEAAGERLAAWIDHHPHPAWEGYQQDPRFVLVDKRTAPACPQLVTEERVRAIGAVDHVLAHADFDGFLSAVKYLNGGRSPYSDADEDGRAIDAPGRGYVCSEKGLRLADAIEWSRDVHSPERHGKLLRELAGALRAGKEDPALATRVDKLASERRQRLVELSHLLDEAKDAGSGILVLTVTSSLRPADKKFLLRELEERSRLVVLEEPGRITVATFDADLPLTQLPSLHGTDGFAWGKGTFASVQGELLGLLAAAA